MLVKGFDLGPGDQPKYVQVLLFRGEMIRPCEKSEMSTEHVF